MEKTEHPCQFPVELVERLVAFHDPTGWLGAGYFYGCGKLAIRCERRSAGAETAPRYAEIARERLALEMLGQLRTRLMDQPIYDLTEAGDSLTVSPWSKTEENQLPLFARHNCKECAT